MVLVFRDVPVSTCDWEQDVDSWDFSFPVHTGKMQRSPASLLRLVHHLIWYVTVFWEGYKWVKDLFLMQTGVSVMKEYVQCQNTTATRKANLQEWACTYEQPEEQSVLGVTCPYRTCAIWISHIGYMCRGKDSVSPWFNLGFLLAWWLWATLEYVLRYWIQQEIQREGSLHISVSMLLAGGFPSVAGELEQLWVTGHVCGLFV